jgi:hypothetical protein
VTIFSFDDVLRAPKSIHSVELTPGGQTKIPLWRPVSWNAFGYFVVVALVFFLASRLPVIDVFSHMFAPLVYYFAFPFGIVWLAFKVELDGRQPHAWAISYLRYLRRPKRVLAGRTMAAPGTEVTYGGRVRVWWDIHAPRLHHGWVVGGRVSTAVPVRFTHSLWHRSQVVVPDADRAPCVAHEVRGRLRVRA